MRDSMADVIYVLTIRARALGCVCARECNIALRCTTQGYTYLVMLNLFGIMPIVVCVVRARASEEYAYAIQHTCVCM